MPARARRTSYTSAPTEPLTRSGIRGRTGRSLRSRAADGGCSWPATSGKSAAVRRLGWRDRDDLGAVDGRRGAVTDWNPRSNGAVEVITVAHSRVYVGGTFTSIGGRSRRATAALDARSANATAWDANVIGTVHAVLPLGKQVYLAGEFESVGGASRSNLASVDAARGAVTSWDPRADASVNVLVPGVLPGRLFAGGA